MMKPNSTALCLVLALGAALASPAAAEGASGAAEQSGAEAQAGAQPSIKPSKEAIKAIIELQTAVNANDSANIPAKLAAAQAVAKTPDDRYAIAGLQYKAAVAANDSAAKAAGIEALIASGKVEQKELPAMYGNLANSYTAMKQPDRAAAALQRLVAIEPNNAEAMVALASNLKAQGKGAEAVALLQKRIAAATASGTKADEELYKFAVQYAYDAKLPSAVPIAREWVAAYPSPTSWHSAIVIFRSSSDRDEDRLLDLLRLQRAAGALSSEAEYDQFAYLALMKGFPAESKAVLDEGSAAGKIDRTKSPFKETYAEASRKAAMDKGALAGAAAAGLKASSAKIAAANAGLLVGGGQYAQAAEVYRAALGKSGADANLINLHLGAALAQAGDKAAATTALNAVTGPNAGLAKLWLTYLATRG